MQAGVGGSREPWQLQWPGQPWQLQWPGQPQQHNGDSPAGGEPQQPSLSQPDAAETR